MVICHGYKRQIRFGELEFSQIVPSDFQPGIHSGSINFSICKSPEDGLANLLFTSSVISAAAVFITILFHCAFWPSWVLVEKHPLPGPYFL